MRTVAIDEVDAFSRDDEAVFPSPQQVLAPSSVEPLIPVARRDDELRRRDVAVAPRLVAGDDLDAANDVQRLGRGLGGMHGGVGKARDAHGKKRPVFIDDRRHGQRIGLSALPRIE